MQGCPDEIDSPPLVVPTTDKLDLEHLFRDLPKYKRWVTASAWEEWEKFIESSPSLLKSDAVKWEIDSLVSAAIRADYARNHAQRESLSPETVQLLAKETAIPAKVMQAYTMVNVHQAIMMYMYLYVQYIHVCTNGAVKSTTLYSKYMYTHALYIGYSSQVRILLVKILSGFSFFTMAT